MPRGTGPTENNSKGVKRRRAHTHRCGDRERATTGPPSTGRRWCDRDGLNSPWRRRRPVVVLICRRSPPPRRRPAASQRRNRRVVAAPPSGGHTVVPRSSDRNYLRRMPRETPCRRPRYANLYRKFLHSFSIFPTGAASRSLLPTGELGVCVCVC